MANACVNIILICLLSCYCSGLPFPLHASCKVNWNFSVDCDAIQNRLVIVINKWNGPDNCKNGGEKCLYELKTRTAEEVKATHETPVKHYVDDLKFQFINKPDGGCTVKGYSRSETWYALFDQGTNYCNLHNLIIGADLNRDPEYKEDTRNSECTQYSKANCDKY